MLGRFESNRRLGLLLLLRDASPDPSPNDALPHGALRDAATHGALRDALPHRALRDTATHGALHQALPHRTLHDSAANQTTANRLLRDTPANASPDRALDDGRGNSSKLVHSQPPFFHESA
jgi:hypothetical protein